MPKFRVEVEVVATEYWLTEIEAESHAEAEERVRKETERHFMPEVFEIDVIDIREIGD